MNTVCLLYNLNVLNEVTYLHNKYVLKIRILFIDLQLKQK